MLSKYRILYNKTYKYLCDNIKQIKENKNNKENIKILETLKQKTFCKVNNINEEQYKLKKSRFNKLKRLLKNE